MNKKRIAAAIAAIGTMALSSLPAFAMEVRRDAENNVYVAGVTPGSSHEVSFEGAGGRVRNVEADRCGVIRISPNLAYAAATKISIGGTESNIAELPVRTPGRCSLVNGAYTSVGQPQETRYKDAIGTIYVQGLTAKSDQVVAYPDLPVGRRITANACGYFRIANSDTQPITDTRALRIDGGSSVTVGSLQALMAPSCRRISETQSVMVVPIHEASSWNSQ